MLKYYERLNALLNSELVSHIPIADLLLVLAVLEEAEENAEQKTLRVVK